MKYEGAQKQSQSLTLSVWPSSNGQLQLNQLNQSQILIQLEMERETRKIGNKIDV